MKDFLLKLEHLQREYDKELGRKYNQDAYSHKIREWSRYLAYIFYKAGLRGHHILFTHFACDIAALIFVALGSPLLALTSWLIGHILDNVDGDLARARGESDPKWGEIDVHLHLMANMAFWVIISFQMLEVVTIYMLIVLLATRVICESHRGEKKYSERWGERSRLWYWLVLPTNVNIMYLSYVVFALTGFLDVYVGLYAVYYYSIFLGQSLKKVFL